MRLDNLFVVNKGDANITQRIPVMWVSEAATLAEAVDRIERIYLGYMQVKQFEFEGQEYHV